MSGGRGVSVPETCTPSRSWSTSLLNWANCILNSSHLSGLNRETLNSLIRYFEKIGNDGDDVEHLEQSLLHFVKKTYPYFRKEGHINIDNSEDVVLVASLLLHFSCVKSKDIAVHNLMCQRLDIVDQKAITTFANNLIKYENITERNLKNAINALSVNENYSGSTCESVSTPVKEDSSFRLPMSPLLRCTPLSAKSRKVFHLEAELGAERFDRNFLQEEVERQNRKIEELLKLQSSYRDEIKRLRGELNVLGEEKNKNDDVKNCSLCKHKDKVYKEEVRSHEFEIMNLLANTKSLEEERDLLKMKYNDTSDAALEWKSQAIELENTRVSLKLQVEEMESEMHTLKTALSEASQCLEEYRRQHQLNKSVECDDDAFPLKKSLSSSLISSTEDLGKAVIDIQLREQINKNAILNNKLEIIAQEKTIMTENFERTKEILALRDSELKKLMENQEILSLEVQKLNHFEEDLKKSQSVLKENIEEIISLKDDVAIKEDLIVNMSRELKMRNDKLIITLDENKEMATQIERNKDVIQNLNTKMNDNDVTIQNLREELSDTKTKHENVEQDLSKYREYYNECEINLKDKLQHVEELQKNIEKLNLEIEEQRVQMLSLEEEILIKTNSNEKLLNDNNVLQNKLDENEKSIRNMQFQIDHQNSSISVISSQLKDAEDAHKNEKIVADIYKTDFELCQKELESKLTSLKESQENNKYLTIELEKYSKDNDLLKNDLKMNIDLVENMSRENISLSNNLEDIKSVMLNLQREIENKNQFISEISEKLNCLEIDYGHEKANAVKNENELLVTKGLLDNATKSLRESEENEVHLNEVIKDYCDKIQSLQKDLEIRYELFEQKSESLEKLMESNINLENEIKRYHDETECLKNELRDNYNLVSTLTEEKLYLEKKLDDKDVNIQNLQCEISDKIILISQLSDKLNSLESELEYEKIKFMKSENEVKNCQQLLKEKIKCIDELLQNDVNLNKIISDCCDEISSLKEQLKTENDKVNTIIKEQNVHLEEISNTKIEINDKKMLISDLSEKLSLLQKDYEMEKIRLKISEDDLKNCQNVLEEKNSMIESILKEKETLHIELVNNNAIIDDLKTEIENNKSVMFEKEKLILEISEKLEGLKNENCNNIVMVNKEIKLINAEVESLRKEVNNNINLVENYKSQLKSCEDLLSEKSNNLIMTMKDYEALQVTFEYHKNQVVKKDENIISLNSEIDNLRLEKENILTNFNNDISVKEKEISTLTQEYNELKRELSDAVSKNIVLSNNLTQKSEILDSVSMENEELKIQVDKYEENINLKIKDISNLTEEVVNLKNDCKVSLEKFNSVLVEKDNDIINSNDTIHKIQIENDSLKSAVNEQEKMITIKDKKILDLTETVAELKKVHEIDAEKYKLVVTQKETELVYFNTTVCELTNKNQDLKCQIDEFEKVVDSKVENETDLRKEIEQLKNNLDIQSEEHTLALTQKEKELAVFDNSLSELRNENNILKTQINECKKTINTKIEETKKLVCDHEDELIDYQLKISEKERKLSNLYDTIFVLQNEIEILKVKLNENKTLLYSTNDDVILLIDEMEEIDQKHKVQTEESKVKLEEKVKELNDCNNTICDLRSENSNLKIQIGDNKQVMDAKYEDFIKMRNEIAELEKNHKVELEEYKLVVLEKEKEMADFNITVIELQNNNDCLKKQIKENDQVVMSKNEKIENLIEEMKIFKNDCEISSEEYKLALSQKEKVINDHQDNICKLQSENDTLKSEIAESLEKLSNKCKELNDLEEKVVVLEVKVNNKELELSTKLNEMEKLNQNKTELVNEISSMKSQQENLITDMEDKQNIIESLNAEIDSLHGALNDALLDVKKLKEDLTEKSQMLLTNSKILNESNSHNKHSSLLNDSSCNELQKTKMAISDSSGNEIHNNSKSENDVSLLSLEENLSFEEFENDLVFNGNNLKKVSDHLEIMNGICGKNFQNDQNNITDMSRSTELIAKACAKNILQKEDIILNLQKKCQSLNKKIISLSADNEQLRIELSLFNEKRNTSVDVMEMIEEIHEYHTVSENESIILNKENSEDQCRSTLQHSLEITSTVAEQINRSRESLDTIQLIDKCIWNELKEFIAKSFDQLAKIHVYLTPQDDNLSIEAFLVENQGESFLTSVDSVESMLEKHTDVDIKPKIELNRSHVYSFMNKSLLFLCNNLKFIQNECVNLKNQLKLCEEKKEDMSMKYLEARANEVDAKQKFSALSEITLDIKREYFEHETELTKYLIVQSDHKNKLKDLKQTLNSLNGEMFEYFNNMEIMKNLYDYQCRLQSSITMIDDDLIALDEKVIDNAVIKKWFYNKMDILMFKLDEKHLQESQDVYMSLKDYLEVISKLSESVNKHFNMADEIVKDYTNYLSSIKKDKDEDFHVLNKKVELSIYEKLLHVNEKHLSILKKENEVFQENELISKEAINSFKKNNEDLLAKNNYLSNQTLDLDRILKETERKNANLILERDNIKTMTDDVVAENLKLKGQLETLTEKLNEINAKFYMGSVKPLVEFDQMLQENMKLSAHAKKLEMEKEQIQTEFNGLQIVHARLLAEHQEVINRDDTNKLVTDLRNEYEDKLSRMKLKMKQLYQQQISVLTKTHQEELETTCKKYVDKIKSYESHVNQMSSELWKVGEKLLMERNEKDWYIQQLKDIRGSRQSLYFPSNAEHRLPISRTSSVLKVFDDSVREIVEGSAKKSTMGRQKKIESGGLHMSDEESEIFDNTYLTDLKTGICDLRQPNKPIREKITEDPSNRLSELQWRNSLCLPHLKSSYPAEMQFQRIKEEDIKMGAKNLDDTITIEKSIRPKKEVGQTTYKRPGPPTPSKKGGRQSLQGADFKEPLKENNENLSKKTSTPSRIKSLLLGNSSKSAKDENTFGTPKGRRISIFRKPK